METKDIVLIGMLGAMLLFSILLMAWNLMAPFFKYNRRRMVVLRMNNEYVRNILKGNGFILDDTVWDDDIALLYSTDGETVHGYAGSYNELVKPLRKIHWTVIDCSVSLSFFVYEMHWTAWRMRK